MVSPADDFSTTATGDPARSRAERWVIFLVLALVTSLLLIAAVQVVGPDVQHQFRRWAGIGGSPLASIAPDNSISAHGVSHQSNSSPTGSILGADAQISPPRRRTKQSAADANGEQRELEPVADPVASAPQEPAGDPVGLPMPDPAFVPPLDSSPNLLETAAQIVSSSWQDFTYPVHWFTSDTGKPRMVYNNHRTRLLKATGHTSPSTLSLEMARKDFEAARAQFDKDPRLDYVFGLVLWKHGQFAEAIESFQIAARLQEVPFLPAALAVAWGRFLNQDERRGLDQLAQISKVLAATGNSYPTDQQKEQAALSIGRALGYLSGSGNSPDDAEYLELTTLNIMKRLPDHLRAACETGQAQVGLRQSELMRLVDLPRDGLRMEHETQRAEIQARLDDLRVEMRDSRNELTRGHVSRLDAMKDILKDSLDVRAQMDRLRPSLKKLAEQAMQHATPQPHYETKAMPSHFHLVTGQGGQTFLVQNNATMQLQMPETSGERAARMSKLRKAQDDMKKIKDDLARLRTKQAELLAKRQEEEQKRKDETEEARSERVARIQEQRGLEQELQSLNKALRRTMKLLDSADSIAAYIPWNVEIEGEALWQALTSKPTGR